MFDAGFGAGGAFLAMELVEGPTLADLFAAGPVPLDRLGAVGVQVAEALAYVHAHGVIHRDVKPANVLIGRDDVVKLADFGIARLVASTTHHTRPDQAIGTAAYLSPEQVRGDEVDASTDVYSLGLVLLEGVTGRRAFEGTPTESGLARLHRAPEVPDDLPEEWHRLLTAMTALKPADRPAADEAATALRAGISGPAPVGAAGVPDATTAPILATGGPDQTPGTIPPPPPYPPPAPAGSPLMDLTTVHMKVPQERQYGAAAKERAQQAAAWTRSLPSHVRGVAAAVGVLILFLVVVAIAGQASAPPAVPDDTPTELRGPLQDLHEAVADADGAPELADQLDRVDDAVSSGDTAAARAADQALARRTSDALLADEITDDQAADVLDAAKALLAQLPKR